MKTVPISAARSVGEKAGAHRVFIIAVNEEGYVTGSTWGKTKADCRAAGTFLDENWHSIGVGLSKAVSDGRK